MPDAELRAKIADYLLARQDWVAAAELCRVFRVNQRALRATGRRAGLCSGCAISGNAGFRHVLRATDSEFADAYRRMRKHALGEMVHARDLLRLRLSRTEPPPPAPVVYERATGQALLSIV